MAVEICLQVFLFKRRHIIFNTKFMFVKKFNCFVKKSVFEKLLLKLTKEYIFSVNSKLIKQIDQWLMGVSVSQFFSDIYVLKWEKTVLL